MRLLLLVCACVMGLALTARPALVWENPEVDLHPGLADKEAVAHFKYKNTGDQPVVITSVHPSCGCTTAELKDSTVKPGASGEITATLHIGGRTGVQTKTITVMTDDQQNPTQLKLVATIPELVKVSPIFIYWRAADPVEPKTVDVKVGPDFDVKKINVSSTDPAVETKVKKAPNGKDFEIVVTPPTTARPINAVLKVVPEFAGPERNFYVNVRVDSHPAKQTVAATPKP